MKTYHDIASDGGSDILGQVKDQQIRLRERLAAVGHIVAIMSGKGGVGKSTVTANLAAALALDALRVGILDGDLNGPSIARMAGVRGHTPSEENAGMTPATAADGVKVMSMDLFLPQDATPVMWEAPTQHSAYTWRSMVEMAALRELLADTAWGDLDILLVDLAPGSDKLPNLADLLPRLSGAIVVSGPTEVSHMVVARSIAMAVQVTDAPLIGVVENMGLHVCAACGREEPLFPAEGATEALAQRHKVAFLGSIPFDPRIALMADRGESYLRQHGKRPAAKAFRRLARDLRAFLAP